MHIVFSGGRTGGHLFPGLAVAEEIRRRDPAAMITFAGSGGPLERQHLPEHGYPLVTLACRPWSPRAWRWPRFAWDHAQGFRAACRWLTMHRPDVVVGLGGWSSVPMIRAAIARRIPLVLLEQNALPGKVTRHFAPHAERVCAALAECHAWLDVQADAFRHTGNPVRREFGEVAIARQSDSAQRRLLVLGGSGGAADLNELVPLAVAKLNGRLEDWQSVHHTGHRDLAGTRARYARAGRWAHVQAFFSNMPELLASSDLVGCRAGGTTLSELAMLGVPAIVVPFPRAADDHQLRNARAYETHGACRVVDFRAHAEPVETLAREMATLVGDHRARESLAAAMRQMARPHAAVDAAEIVMQLAGVTPVG